MTDTLYHKLLRVSALSLAFVLLFVSGVITPITKSLSTGAGTYLATAIGINAAVLPTEVNTLSAQLEERDREITQREIAVNLKEANEQKSEVATYIMSVLLFILLTLIILNYVLDFMRAKSGRKEGVPA
jgi:hypothetical protein